MGQLVFQATAGGQVALVGPNPSTNFALNVPAVNGNLVTTGDTGTVTSTMLASNVYTAPGTIGSVTPNTGAFTTLSASSTVSGTGFSNYLASPPAIGATSASTGKFTSLTNTGLTSGRVTYAGTGGLLTDSANLVFNGSQLGVGATPNTWNTFNAVEIGNPGNFIAGVTGSPELDVGSNAYFASGWKYSGSSTATLYQANNSNNGSHVFYGTPTGTAGNAITWTPLLSFRKDNTLVLQGGTSSAGTGIAFPATQSASSDANTLDDYEKGTWTVTDQSGAGLSLASNTGTYTKIGRVVYYAFDVTFPTTANTTNVKLSLPITGQTGLGGSSGAGAIGYCNIGSTGITAYMGFPTNLTFYTMTLGVAVTNANLSGKELSVAGFYIAA